MQPCQTGRQEGVELVRSTECEGPSSGPHHGFETLRDLDANFFLQRRISSANIACGVNWPSLYRPCTSADYSRLQPWQCPATNDKSS